MSTMADHIGDGERPRANVVGAISMLRRRIALFLVAVLVFEGLAIGAAMIKQPKFTASARVVFDPRSNAVLKAPANDPSLDSMAVDTQVEVLKSRATIERVIKQNGLTKDPEFNKQLPPGLLAGLTGGAQRQATSKGQDPLMDATVQNLSERLSGNSLGLSSVIQVSFRSKSPLKSAQLANAFAEAYIATQLSVKTQAAARMLAELESRLAELRANAERSDTAWREYQVASGLVTTQSAAGATALQQEIQSLTMQLAEARAGQAIAQAQQGVVAGLTGARDTFGEAQESPVLQALKRQRNEVSAKLAEANVRYGPRHPEVLAQTQALRDIEAQINDETDRVRRTVTSQSRAAQSRTAAIEGQLAAANARLQRANIASVGESQLKNRAEADMAIYQTFLERYKQVSAEAGMERPDARIISYAAVPTKPSSLPRSLIAALGLLVGCAAGLVLVVLVEALFGGVYNTAQVTSAFGVPCLGYVPELESIPMASGGFKRGQRPSPTEAPLAEPLSPFSEMLRNLLAAEPFNLGQHRNFTVMLSSSVAGEGKSTCSIALARSLTLQGARVLLIDADLIRHAATRHLGAPQAGLVELIDGTASLSQVLQKDPLSGLYWIGVSKHVAAPGAFAKPAFRDILADLRARFDIIILDAAPILATADARRLAQEVDRVVMAIRWSKTPRSAIRAAFKVFRAMGIPVAGAILTRVDMQKQARMGDADRFDDYYQYQAYSV